MTRDVPIVLDKERNLRYNINALCAVEEKSGMGFENLMIMGGVSALRLLLWAGLKHEEENPTVQEVGEMMDLYIMKDGKDLETLGDRMQDALIAAGFREPEEDEEIEEVEAGNE